jgi:hypothetical protein
MIDTFCQLGYLNASKHKTGAMEIQVIADFMDADGLMIIPTQEYLEGRLRPGSTTIHPGFGVAENRKPLPLLQPKTQPLSTRTRSNTKPPPKIDLTKKESTDRSARFKKRISYCEKYDDDEEEVKSRSSKRRKNNNKHDYQDEDEDYQDKDDNAKENDEINGENN